jgi:putative membrane protein
MNTPILLLAAALAALSGPAAAAEGEPLNDAQIAGILFTANQGEIDAARVATDKARGADVKEFAERMKKDHGDTRTRLSTVIEKSALQPNDSAAADLVQHGADETALLEGTSRDDFDLTYMNAQVADHAALLQKLDDDLIPNAKDPNLLALLRQVRAVVVHHLARARRIQAELKARERRPT